jgi:hypothetical protein
MEPTDSKSRTIDVTGLSEKAIRAVESLVATLREQADPAIHFRSPDEWSKALYEWAASHPVLPNSADWSRESIYAGRGE